jgi:tripartite-type tricarboxylate transporter receptor subunit TctC
MMGLRIASVAIVAAGLLAPGAAHAQSYPTKPVKLIVPFAAGGPIDVMGRLVAQWLSSALGQQVVVDNRPGASGAIGTRAAAAAEPDGHTLLIGSVTKLATGPLSPRTSVTIRARISSRLRSWRARRSRWW